MMDYSFLKFYKNDFAGAKKADDCKIATIKYGGFITQLPNETFYQISNSIVDISFVGAILVELVDNCENVIKDITSNFYYANFTDSNGVEQIRFEFGNINQDYYSTLLFIRITDNINGNKFYTNGFLITDYQSEKSTRFDYWNETKINGISYDLANQKKQSIRVADCYYHSPVNEENLKQYTQYSGLQTSYRSIVTYLRKYLMTHVDNFINDRMYAMFQSQFIYVDYERVKVSGHKSDERNGETNIFNSEFVINPQNETLVFEYQLYEPFDDVSVYPLQGTYTASNFNVLIDSDAKITFNKDVFILPTFEYKLYKDGALVLTSFSASVTTNVISLLALNGYVFSNGVYSLVASGLNNGGEVWDGFLYNEIIWNIESGQYDAGDYDNLEYLIN